MAAAPAVRVGVGILVFRGNEARAPARGGSSAQAQRTCRLHRLTWRRRRCWWAAAAARTARASGRCPAATWSSARCAAPRTRAPAKSGAVCELSTRTRACPSALPVLGGLRRARAAGGDGHPAARAARLRRGQQQCHERKRVRRMRRSPQQRSCARALSAAAPARRRHYVTIFMRAPMPEVRAPPLALRPSAALCVLRSRSQPARRPRACRGKRRSCWSPTSATAGSGWRCARRAAPRACAACPARRSRAAIAPSLPPQWPHVPTPVFQPLATLLATGFAP
jgi:hypothetical protein